MKHSVKVIPDPTNGKQLIADPPSFDMAFGDWVDWEFQNEDQEMLPVIVFDDSSGLGPFQYMQSSSDNSVQGLGSIETDGPFHYTAMLLDADGCAQSSGMATVNFQNKVLETNSSPTAIVQFDPQAVPPVTVTPATLQLFPGATALWVVQGLPEGFFITFLFNLPDHPITSGKEMPTGLFDSLATSRRVIGDEDGFLHVLGVDFAPPAETPSFGYRIVVRNRTGDVFMTSPDPIIDNLGPPPGKPIEWGRRPRGRDRRRA